MSDISNVQNEVLFVGCFFKNPDLYVEYGRYVKSHYDLSDDVTKFLYDNFETYYRTFSQTVDEMKMNTFMSQSQERLKDYKRFGGYKTIKTWMSLADDSDFENYMETVKKYSLLREYDRKGFNVDKIMSHRRFETMKASDIYRIVRSGADKIGTVILSNESSIVANEGMKESILGWINKPSIGVLTPFNIINELFRGLRKSKFMANAMLSNSGKSRFAILLAAYVTLVKGEKTLILANEMGEEDFRACLLTTVINNTWFKALHGVDIEKKENEIVLGLYRDKKGEFIKRLEDENGYYTETEKEYYDRLCNESEEFRKVLEVSNWIEQQTENKIFFKQLFDYSDDVLDMEIRKHKIIHGIDYIFYDTLKPSKSEDWALFKQTATKLNSLAMEIDVFIFGSLQMTDDAVFTEIFGLSSNNIASAKSVKHILDYLCLSKHLNKEEYHKYRIIKPCDEWGSEAEIELNPKKRYCATKIDKNRSGRKDLIPVYEVDLDLNTWVEVGHLVRAKQSKKGE